MDGGTAKGHGMSAIGGDLYESEIVDKDGATIGSVGQVYLDDETGQPSWVTVKTGLFGTHEAFIPLEHALVTLTHIKVPYSASFVKDAPSVDTDHTLEPAEEARLQRYYGLWASGERSGGSPSTAKKAHNSVPNDVA